MKILCIIFQLIIFFISHLMCMLKEKKTQQNKIVLKYPQSSTKRIVSSITSAIS